MNVDLISMFGIILCIALSTYHFSSFFFLKRYEINAEYCRLD